MQNDMMKKLLSLFLLFLLGLTGCAAQETAPQAASHRVVIALLDIGVAPDAVHSEHLLPGHNYVTDTDDTADQINHGTAVASVILGSERAGVTAAAPDACVLPLVIATKTTRCSAETLAQAVRDSIDVYNADIINISIGIRKDEPALRDAVHYAEEQGVPVVSPVGNSGPDEPPCRPAAYDIVLAVGSCDRNEAESDFTQSGADVLAPGEDIWLASRDGKTYGARGTSFACGFVSAGAANLLRDDPMLTPPALRDRLCSDEITYSNPSSGKSVYRSSN